MNNLRQCNKCFVFKENSDFYPNSSNKDKISHVCKECEIKKAKQWQKDNPERVILNRFKKNIRRRKRNGEKYGLTIEKYEQLLNEQFNCCAICKNKSTNQRLSIDHCHSTGIVRGLLCRNCNFALGLFKDNVSFLQEAIKYLEKLYNVPQHA